MDARSFLLPKTADPMDPHLPVILTWPKWGNKNDHVFLFTLKYEKGKGI